MALSFEFSQKLQEQGRWGEGTDPSSGYPLLSARATTLYSDVEAASLLLKYETIDIGCKVVVHPKWKQNVYLATLFSDANSKTVLSVLKQCRGFEDLKVPEE